MKRSLVLRVLAAVCVVSLALVAAPSSADEPGLSTGCSNRHANPNLLLSAQSGTLVLTADFNAGEQLLIENQQFDANATVAAPDGPSAFPIAAHAVARYDVLSTGEHRFTFKGSPQGTPVSVRFDCGLPPRADVTDVDEGESFVVGQNTIHYVRCTGQTNPATSCVLNGTELGPDCAALCGDFPVDTAVAGDHAIVLVATDSRGLRTSRTVHYTVAKKAQALHFTTPNPGLVERSRYGVQIDAVSDSGLPVTISVDPTSPGCGFNPFGGFIYGNISIEWSSGRCTVWADQAGNEAVLPAQRIEMTFQVDRLRTYVTAIKASKGLLGLTPTTFRADLETQGFFGPGGLAILPFIGPDITFYVAGKRVCTAPTRALPPSDGHFFGQARATCKAAIGLKAALMQTSYTAAYAGDAGHHSSSAAGKLQ